jgi:hypothetical protein
VLVALVVFCSMAPMDTAAALKIVLLTQGRPWAAGGCEVVNDYGGILSYGVGGASVLKYGLSFTTVVIFVALGAASLLGTRAGYWLAHRGHFTVHFTPLKGNPDMTTTPPVVPAPVVPAPVKTTKPINAQEVATDIGKVGTLAVAVVELVLNAYPKISVPGGAQAIASAIVVVATGLLSALKQRTAA